MRDTPIRQSAANMHAIDREEPANPDVTREFERHDGRQLIFVGGAPRSGTTLVQNMLDSHPEIFGGPEFLHIPEIIELRDRMHHSVSRHLIDQVCSHGQVDAQFRTLIEGFLMPPARQPDIRLISEKTPGNVLVFAELMSLWPRALHSRRSRSARDHLLHAGGRRARGAPRL